MPPMRQAPAKVTKTERTHEENQERAYIAASRRSDRSLEARVESARRASEIHKKRTGRGLRVTEQDVINEEMYEEEEDDLPLPYRRILAANMQTNSPEFNKKLSTYLACNGAMRSALAQALNPSYSIGNPNMNMNMAPQYGYSPQSMFPSPMLGFQVQQQQTMQQQQMMIQQQQQQQIQLQQPKQHIQQNGIPYRQAPYPQPRSFQSQHQRSASIAIPNEHSGSSNTNSPAMIKSDHRRMSMSSASPMATPVVSSTNPLMPSPMQTPSFSLGSFSEIGVEHRQSQDASNQQIQSFDTFPLTIEAPENWNMFMSYNDIDGLGNSSQQNYLGNFGSSQTVDLKDLNFGVNSTLGSTHIQMSQATQSFSESINGSVNENLNDTSDQGYFAEDISSLDQETPSGTPRLDLNYFLSEDAYSIPTGS